MGNLVNGVNTIKFADNNGIVKAWQTTDKVVEVKAKDNATASLNTLIKSDAYPDVKYGIKFCYKNIGFDGKFYTFPYFLDADNAPKIGCCELDFGGTHLYILDSNQPLMRQFKQRKWLINKLESAENDERKIVALHHPLRSARGRFNNLIVRWMYEEVVKQYNVELVLAGHEHTNHTLTKEETGGYEQIITNFSSKSYDDAKGEKGRKVVILTFAR